MKICKHNNGGPGCVTCAIEKEREELLSKIEEPKPPPKKSFFQRIRDWACKEN